MYGRGEDHILFIFKARTLNFNLHIHYIPASIITSAALDFRPSVFTQLCTRVREIGLISWKLKLIGMDKLPTKVRLHFDF